MIWERVSYLRVWVSRTGIVENASLWVGELVSRVSVIEVMNKYKRVGCIALALLSMATMVAEAGSLYRYRNKEGNLVVDYTIPPEYVAGGYEVISKSGRVEQVVLPHRDPDASEGEEHIESSEAVAGQLEENQMLLHSYSEVSEIEAARERRVAQLDREVEITQSNLLKNRDMQKNARVKAANYQLSGKSVPKPLLKYMDNLALQDRVAVQVLELRKKESETVSNRYKHYRLRFMVLKGIEPLEKSPTSLPTTVPATVPSDDD
jgi:hypothetical protein